jgi:hypothetical protein
MAGGSERAWLEVFAPGDHVSTRDGPELRRLAQPGEVRKFAHVVFISAAGFGIGNVGEPFELGRYVGEVAELGRRRDLPTAPPRAARRENEHNSSFLSGSLFQRDFDQFLSIAITTLKAWGPLPQSSDIADFYSLHPGDHQLGQQLLALTRLRLDLLDLVAGSSVLQSSRGIGVGHGINPLSVYRGERFVQGLEDVIGADDVVQAVAVQIGSQRRFRMNE